MTNLPSDILGEARYLIYKFELTGFDFKNIDQGQFFTLNYEKKRYRQNELVNILFSVLPYFALTEIEFLDYSERLKSPNFFTKKAIKRIVKPGNKAGDYGEVILFIILELFYQSKKLVTKVLYKTSAGLPVFGADAVHFTAESDGSITLWFGEAKFYKDFSHAVAAAFVSVDNFLKTKLEGEVELLVPSKIEINKKTDPALHRTVIDLIENDISLDDLQIKIPILLTYELEDLKNYDDIKSSLFIEKLNKECEMRFKLLQSKNWQKYYRNVSFVFFLLPIQDMKALKDLIRVKDDGIRI